MKPISKTEEVLTRIYFIGAGVLLVYVAFFT